MSCPFNRDVYTGDPFLDWLGSSIGKPLSYYEGRYKKKKTETTDTTSKPEGVTVSTNDTSGNWGFTSQGAGINYNNTSNSNTSSNNYSVFRNTNTNAQGSLTHNVFSSGYKKQSLSNYNNIRKLMSPNYDISKLPFPNYGRNTQTKKEENLYMFNGKPFNGEVKNFGSGGTTVYRGGKSVLSLPNWEWQGGR